jgi:trimethylamine--corrinoid protein Co-methyltransferase
MGGAMVAALAGINMVSGAGMMDFETCLSYEKLVIDAETIGLVRRFIGGIQVREEPIALGVMRQVGHRGDYLTQQHTHRWFRKELSMPSVVIDRGSLDAWQKKGSKSTYERAADRVEQVLKNYQPSPLPDDLRGELRSIAAQAAQKFGMDALPPLPPDEQF